MNSATSRLIRAGVFTAIIDGLFSSILSIAFYGSTVTRLWQGVASALLGPTAIDGGTTPVIVGLVMHVTVAFFWSAVFLFLMSRVQFIQRVLQSPMGVLKVAVVYGPIIWSVMSLIVLPFLLHRPPSITSRWWIQFFGHIPFVAFPIVYAIGRPSPTSTQS